MNPANAGSLPRLRILLVEDSRDDAEWIERELRRSGYEADWKCVAREADFQAALSGSFDIVLADYSVPGFGALRAIEVLRRCGKDIPLIVVTGSISEEVAVECMKRGAADYLLKDRLARLGSAVERALREKQLRDENRRKEAELERNRQELLQAQKMEAIGRLGSGVAHDFNNILTAILGYCDLLAPTFPEVDARHEIVSEIRRAAERASALTSQLLTFSRKQVLHPTVLDLNAVVKDLLRMASRVIGEDVRIETDLAPALGFVKVDRGHVEQVLMNLLVNSRDAMPAGGMVRITTRNSRFDPDAKANVPTPDLASHVLLAVEDDGIGMDEATKACIFEPFFTTKPVGKGTGLGLSTVYGIVAQSGGRISVFSEPGRGTRFEIALPRTDEAPSAAVPSPIAARRAHRSATILLIEDDSTLRGLFSRVLAADGFSTLVEADGTAGLECAKRYPGRIDLVVTDIVMPGLAGTELVRRLMETRPGIRILLISGYSEIGILDMRELPRGTGFLAKPFTASRLLELVKKMLEEPAPPEARQ